MTVDVPAWKRFGGAMLALSVAFLLAVYSDILAHEGNVLGTAVAGSLALGLAGFVAVTAVPYLARRTSLGWLRASIDYHLTREGMVFIASVFVLSIAALNTGNNMLFLIVATMLAAILVSGVVSRMVLEGVELDVLLPDHVFARQPVLARLRLKNRKRLAPSFSIAVVGDERGRGSDGHPRDNILGPGVYFPYVRSGSTVTQSVEVRFPRRGNYHQDHFGISTRFPFGFLEKVLKVPARRELLVYPAVEPTEEFYEVLPLLSGELESYLRGRGHDLYTIRDYQPGDGARFVDWKASAHTGLLMVREFTREDERRVQLVFDRARPPAAAPKGGERFERAVEFCAALAWHFYQIDSQLEFLSDDFRTPSAPAAEVVFDILRYLATVQARASQQDFLAAIGDTGSFKIILTSAAPGSIPTHLWTCSYFLFLERL
jgi:uncharacterized protein (DUF58 family)